MRLLALAGDIDALIAQIRLVAPLTALCQRQGWSLTLKSFHDCAGSDLIQADVLVVQRAATARVLRLQRRMRQQGGAVIYEIDDLLTEVAPHISNQAAVRKRVTLLRQCMAQADAVTVSTARLGRELGQQQAIEVPNHALAPSHEPLPRHDSAQAVTLLFASSDRLATDFIYAAVRCLQSGQGATPVRLVVVGPPAQGFAQAGLAVQAEPLMPRDRFVAFARSLPNPLAVIPLEDSRFAACKSAVKWFDYAEAGVPTLCSDVSPYTDVMAHGRTGGLVDNTSAAWQQALHAAVADAAWRQGVAVAARAQVRAHHTLQHTVDAWQHAVLTAVNRRQQVVVPPPGLAGRAHDALAAALDGGLLRLRVFNRARLVKRSRR